MAKRTFKNGKIVSTYGINGVFESVIYGKYGEIKKSLIATNVQTAMQNHWKLVDSL